MASGAIPKTKSWVILAACFCAALFDGFDMQMIGFLAPAIAQDMNVDPLALGAIFSASILGMACGAVLLAPLADRLGRRKVAILASALVSIFTLLTAKTYNIETMVIARFMCGIALGAIAPTLITIAHEAAPPHQRGLYVTLLITGLPLGGFFGGLAVSQGLDFLSWNAVFLLAGVGSLATTIILWLTLPQTLGSPASDVSIRRGQAKELLRPEIRVSTTLLWFICFSTLLNNYLLSNWIPLFLERYGYARGQAINASALFSLGGAIGGILWGYTTHKTGPRTLWIAYAIASVCLAGLAFLGGATLLILMALLFIAGCCIPGGSVGNNVVAAALYPTAIRATGVGWAQAAGRVGAFFGPGMAGVMLQMGLPLKAIFLGAAVVALSATIAAFVFARHPKRFGAPGMRRQPD